MNELDEFLTWDIKLSLALAAVALVALVLWAIAEPLMEWIHRFIKWRRYSRHSQLWLPHAGSDKPWRQNHWKTERSA